MMQATVYARLALLSLALSNVVLVGMLGYQLRVTPSDVRNQLLLESSAIRAETESLRRIALENYEEIRNRAPRLNRLEEAIQERMTDRVYRQEVIEWIEKAQQLNPDLTLPAMDKLNE